MSPHHSTNSPTVSPQELLRKFSEPALSPQETTTSSKEPSVVIQEPFANFQGPDTVPPQTTEDIFSSSLRSPSPLHDTFTAPSLLRSDSPDLLTQMQQQLGLDKWGTGLILNSKAPDVSMSDTATHTSSFSSSYNSSVQRPERTSQPDSGQQPTSYHTSSLDKAHSDSSLKFNSPAAVVAPPINIKLIGSDSPDGNDGGIRIQRVQKTRWTPKSNSNEPGVSSHTPDQEVPSLTPQHHHSPGKPRDDRCATLPNMRHQNAKQKMSPSRERRDQNQSGSPAVVARGIGGLSVGLGDARRTPASGQPVRTSSTNPYQPRNLQQAWKSQEELRNQRVNSTASRKATTPDGSKVFRVNPSNSFSQGPVNGQRNRAKTWSNAAVQDGFQAAYTGQPKNPYDLCSRCHQPLGQDNIVSVPMLRTQYHPKCLVCRVCKTPLSSGAKTTSILMKNKQPHCKSCGSSNGSK